MSHHGRIGVGVVVLDPAGRVLIGRRVKAGEPVTWCLPGGHVEAGETFEQAGLRELAEETGLCSGSAARTFVVATALDDRRPNVTAGIAATLADPAEQPRVTEPEAMDAWAWAPLDDLPQPLYPATAMVLAAWRGADPGPHWSTHRVGLA